MGGGLPREWADSMWNDERRMAAARRDRRGEYSAIPSLDAVLADCLVLHSSLRAFAHAHAFAFPLS